MGHGVPSVVVWFLRAVVIGQRCCCTSVKSAIPAVRNEKAEHKVKIIYQKIEQKTDPRHATIRETPRRSVNSELTQEDLSLHTRQT